MILKEKITDEKGKEDEMLADLEKGGIYLKDLRDRTAELP